MSLSNTATPIYYGRFREAVLRGEIPVNHKISMQMNRIDDLIADPRYYYDDTAIDGFIAYCENELTLTDGSDVVLTDAFKLWAEDLLSWFYFVEKSVYVPNEDGHGGHYELRKIKYRLRNKQFIITARGTSNTTYESFIQNYFLNIDRTRTQQVHTSPTVRQSDEMMSTIRTSIVRSKGPLFKFLTLGSIQNTTGSKANRPRLCSTKKGIQNFMTNSIIEVCPMTRDKLQGRKDKIATVDEWLSCDIREDVIGAIEQGATKNKDWVIVAVSSEGTVRNGPGDDIKLELDDILKGEYIAPHVSIWWYRLDDKKEVEDPSMWIKANPNLGITVSYETYQRDVERAEKAPAAMNDILAKRFGIPMEGYTYFFTYEETELTSRRRSYWQLPCAMGADLSRGDDFCAFTFLFPLPNGKFGIKARSYITEHTLNRLTLSMRLEYEKFIEEGSLIVMPGIAFDDLNDVYDNLDRFIMDNGYDVRCFGYDPYNARAFVERWEAENGPFGIEKVIQGRKTESVPLGELKKFAEDRMLLFDEEIMKFCMGNCVVNMDVNGNKMLLKARREQKIDNVAALMDAYVAYKLNTDAFE